MKIIYKWIVYCTINSVNNKYYVGVHKTIDPEVFDGYIGCGVVVNAPSSYMYPETPFQAAVKKYGPSKFKRSVLYVFDTAKDAYDKEKEIVNADFIRRDDVYNACLGGANTVLLNPVNQFDLNGNFIKTWDLIIDAADFFGISGTAISRAITLKGSSKGYYWSKNKSIDVSEFVHNLGTKCYKYDAETLKYIESYQTFPEAAKANDVHLATIERAIKAAYKVNGYYYSAELMDKFVPRPKLSIKNKTLYVYDLSGNYVTELHNGKEICKFFNVKSTHAITVAMRTGRQYKQYQLSLDKEEKLNPIKDLKNHSVKVVCYTKDGVYVETFDSITAASKKYGYGVNKVIRGQQQHTKGFIFRKVNDIVESH